MVKLLDRLDLPRLLHVSTVRRPPRFKHTVVFLHGIGSSGKMWRQIENDLPDDTRVISLDLLGFGASPKPKSASYNVRVQARSVALTLFRLRLSRQVIVVGHSMGSLIAIELARRYPLMVRGLVLCSPPIYQDQSERQKILSTDRMLRKVYQQMSRSAAKNPERALRLANRSKKPQMAQAGFQLNADTLPAYLLALQAAIIEQSAMKDAARLKLPIKIIYGTLDPFVVARNLRTLAKSNPRISVKRIISIHDINQTYKKPILRALEPLLKK